MASTSSSSPASRPSSSENRPHTLSSRARRLQPLTHPAMTILKSLPAEIDGMRVAGRLASEVLDFITPHVKAGRHHRRTRPAVPRLHGRCPGHRSGAAELRAARLPARSRKSICTSVNHVVCHGVPGERAQAGDSSTSTSPSSRTASTATPAACSSSASRRSRRGACATSPTSACGAASTQVRPGATSATSAMRSSATPRARLQRGARVLRPRHRPQVPRGAAGPALRPPGHGAES